MRNGYKLHIEEVAKEYSSFEEKCAIIGIYSKLSEDEICCNEIIDYNECKEIKYFYDKAYNKLYEVYYEEFDPNYLSITDSKHGLKKAIIICDKDNLSEEIINITRKRR